MPAATIALRVFLPFCFGFFVSYLFRSVNAIVADDLVAELGLSAAELGILSAALLLAFTFVQLPAGVLLDRIGARLVVGWSLALAAGGAVLFARAESFPVMFVARLMLGLGTSCCLMGGLKALSEWYEVRWLPLVNGWFMGIGSAGALTVAAAGPAIAGVAGWRTLFLAMGAATALCAALILLVAPDRRVAQAGTVRGGGFGEILVSATFWRLAPAATLTIGAFMNWQGLWVGPWFADVGNLDRAGVATGVGFCALGMSLGYALVGTATQVLERRGIPPLATCGGAMALFVAVQIALAFGSIRGSYLLWAAFGFLGSTGTVAYSIFARSFPLGMVGRVNTLLNLAMFCAAFAMQWGVGLILDRWPAGQPGHYLPEGYAWALGSFAALQAVSILWMLRSDKR